MSVSKEVEKKKRFSLTLNKFIVISIAK